MSLVSGLLLLFFPDRPNLEELQYDKDVFLGDCTSVELYKSGLLTASQPMLFENWASQEVWRFSTRRGTRLAVVSVAF